MWNNELYQLLEKKHGRENMTIFSEIVSDMYLYLYLDSTLNNAPDLEFDFERGWWKNKYEELVGK